LQGAVTANRADQLATALADYGSTTTGDVVVDASELTAIDMTALDALKTAQGALHDSGRRLVLDHWPVQYRGALVRAGISSLAGFGFERSP
jgi:anti-anti-sigma regulatory factor